MPFPPRAEPPWRSQLAYSEQQLENLRASARTYVESSPWSSRVTHDTVPLPDDFIEVTTTVYAQLTSRAPESLGHQVGDILKSLRSALDYLAKGLSDGSGRPAFPIYEKGSNFANDVNRKLKGISAQGRTAITALQPFNDPNGAQANPLWQLNALRNVDVHDHPNSLTAALYSAEMDMALGPMGVTLPLDQIPLPQGLSFDEERQVARVTSQVASAWIGLNYTQPRLGWSVAFGPDTPLPLHPVRTTLKRIHQHVTTVVLPALEPLVTQ